MTAINSAASAPMLDTATTSQAGKVKAAAAAVRAAGVNALDAVSPACVPFAQWWDTEADRRRQLRTPENLKALMAAQRAHTSARSTAASARAQRKAATKATRNPLAADRRAARTADKAATRHRREAKAALRAARRDYPATLLRRAVGVHTGHAVPAAVTSWALSTPADWTLWPASLSAGLVGLNAAALWLGRRSPAVRLDDGLTEEERRLAARLDPSHWVAHADARGLAGTVPTPAELTPAGLVSHVRLDGRWTPKAFRDRVEEIRALLGCRTDLRVEIKAGTHGDRATITLRTRSAADGAALTGWAPGAPWGVDTITGEPVAVPLGRRMLIAGTSGSGKSWSARALLAEASERQDHRLVVIDPKRVEAINWQHRARVAITPDEVLTVTAELLAEMHERLELVPRGRDTIEITPERPRITVFVDEGAEVIGMSRKREYRQVLDDLVTLARMARAAEIIVIWATQKPTMDAKGGIDPQISAQITYRAALALSTSAESRVVFGEDATERGWHAHDLPMPGFALLRSGPKSRPHPIKTRAFSPADVIALPERPVWARSVAQGPEGPRGLSLLKGGGDTVPAAGETNREKVLRAVRNGAASNRDIVSATGLNKGTVSRELRALAESGEIVRDDSGRITPGRAA